MKTEKLLKQILLTAALLAGAGLVQAEEEAICSSFMDSQINESLLATMLSAAHDGHLYRIRKTSSQVGFCVNSKMSLIEGNFTDFQGGISINPEGDDNGQTMVMIKAGSLDTGATLIENMLKSKKFFDVENHPDVLFISNTFEWTGPETAVLKGDLTMRGITKPVIFDITLKALDAEHVDQAQEILVKATTTINRADFGMQALSGLVDGDVQLCLSVEAQKYHG